MQRGKARWWNYSKPVLGQLVKKPRQQQLQHLPASHLMKHLLAILALLALTAPASAQIDKSPWYGQPTQCQLLYLLGSPYFRYPELAPAPVPAFKIPLPPAEFDKPFTGHVVVTRWNDYSFVRNICKDAPNAIACTLRTYNPTTGAPIACLIMLGPMAHTDERALRHEMAHCNGWPNTHEGARHGDSSVRSRLMADCH